MATQINPNALSGTVQIPDEVRWDTSQPTSELRWVRRRTQVGANPMDVAYVKFLQQRWLLKSIINDVVVEAKYEWRDVPEALEDET